MNNYKVYDWYHELDDQRKLSLALSFIHNHEDTLSFFLDFLEDEKKADKPLPF